MNPLNFALPVAFVLAATTNAAGAESKDPRIGEAAQSICFARQINGFQTIDGADNAVLLNSGVRELHYVTLAGLCTSHELRFAQAVAIDQRPGGGCVTRGDRLIFSDSVFFDDKPGRVSRCVITGIYRWNPDAKAPTQGAAKGEETNE